jgi:hypothetical protein
MSFLQFSEMRSSGLVWRILADPYFVEILQEGNHTGQVFMGIFYFLPAFPE